MAHVHGELDVYDFLVSVDDKRQAQFSYQIIKDIFKDEGM